MPERVGTVRVVERVRSVVRRDRVAEAWLVLAQMSQIDDPNNPERKGKGREARDAGEARAG